MKNISLIILLLLAECTVLFSQTVVENSQLSSETYFTPDALNTGVNLFRGDLQVSIPIYEYKTANLSLPISLNYSVPKKDYNTAYHPGWTGWGWQLSAGGYISRRIKGIPDDRAENNRGERIWPEYYNSTYCDSMEDEFSFNFCGYSGTFFNYQGRFIVNSEQDLWIGCVWNNPAGLTNRTLRGFVITTPGGIKYHFGKGENSAESLDINNAPSVLWYLTQIEAPEGDCINLNYENADFVCDMEYGSTTVDVMTFSGIYLYGKKTPSNNDPVRAMDAFVRNKAYLKSISGGAVTINFNRLPAIEKDYPERDLPILTRKYNFDSNLLNRLKYFKLSEIVLKDEVTGQNFKKFTLNYTSSTAHVLKLLSMQEHGILPNGSMQSKPAYSFEYDYKQGDSPTMFGVIRKMTYPTGGYSLFEYGYHWSMKESDNQPYQSDIGYRIQRILSYGAENEIPSISEYSYTFPDGTGSGKKSRNKMLTDKTEFWDGRRTNVINRTSTKDMAVSPTFDADLYGYSCVTEEKSYGGVPQDASRYYFINYDNTFIYRNNICRDFSGDNQIGNLVRKEELRGSFSAKQVTYDYNDSSIESEILSRKVVEYLPINSTQSMRKEWTKKQDYRKYRPKRIMETVSNEYEGMDSLAVTVVEREYETGNKLSETTTDIYGNIYKTEYKYITYADMLISGYKRYDMPYEIVRWKNGKVIGAEVIQYTKLIELGSGYFGCRKPSKRYVLEAENPISDYQTASYGTAERMDSRCRLVETFDYYPESKRLRRYQQTGKEPVIFYWNDYGNISAQIVGAEYDEIENIRPRNPYNYGEPRLNTNPLTSTDMQVLRARLPQALVTTYYYTIYGLASVTDPTGQTQYIEYDAFGQPVKMLDDAKNILQTIQYNYLIQ